MIRPLFMKEPNFSKMLHKIVSFYQWGTITGIIVYILLRRYKFTDL